MSRGVKDPLGSGNKGPMEFAGGIPLGNAGIPLQTVTAFGCLLVAAGCDGGHCNEEDCYFKRVSTSSNDYVIALDRESSARVEMYGHSVGVPVYGEAIVRFEEEGCIPEVGAPCNANVRELSITLLPFEIATDSGILSHDGVTLSTQPGALAYEGHENYPTADFRGCGSVPGGSRNLEVDESSWWTIKLDAQSQSLSLTLNLNVDLPVDNHCGSEPAAIVVQASGVKPWRRGG